MSKEEAIKRLDVLCDFGLRTILDKEQIKDIDTVLGYVKELEEERKLRIHYENRLDNMEQLYVDKDKIRDKIEELRKEKLKYDNEIRIYTMRESFDFQEAVLKELLEEE